jgi:NAD+ synthase (glutamine-hydrolysing)
VLYANQVGGNDELVFDGASFVLNAAGSLERQLACCRQQLTCWDPPTSPPALAPTPGAPATDAPAPDATAPGAPAISPLAIPLVIAPSLALPDPREQLLRALVLGVADYAHKCGFRQALLGLSGGIDSALVAVIAAAALGARQVHALLMPSPWSSAGSINDASALAARLGIATATLPIAPLMAGFDGALAPALPGGPQGVTAENLQSRIRGTLLMAVANQRGQLLLSTGNKSELAVGYCTLYGDMNGGLAVIGDLYKTTVFSLCEWIDSPAAANCRAELALPSTGELVGLAIRHKPPSAELRPDQLDSDSLPDYAVLDPLLKAYIERHWSLEELIAHGSPPELARRVQQLLRRSEFKRRQAAPALKVSGRAFGSGWRMPIAAA